MTEESLFNPSQAPVFGLNKMLELWSLLGQRRLLIHLQVAVISYICYWTGARTKEICDLKIQDISFRKQLETVFLNMPLRSSKSNRNKERRENIILPITKRSPWPILNNLLTLLGDRKTGRIFPSLNTDKVNYHYRSAAKTLNWPIKPTGHSMRISFVINSIIAGAPDSCIIACCRWQTPGMLELYKNSVLQDTIYGSAYKTVRLIEKHFQGIKILHTNKTDLPSSSGHQINPTGNNLLTPLTMEENPTTVFRENNRMEYEAFTPEILSTSFDPRDETTSTSCPTCGLFFPLAEQNLLGNRNNTPIMV